MKVLVGRLFTYIAKIGKICKTEKHFYEFSLNSHWWPANFLFLFFVSLHGGHVKTLKNYI